MLVANKNFQVTVLFIIYFCDQFVGSEIRQRHHCSVSTINVVFSDEDKFSAKILFAISMGKDSLFSTPKISKFVDE